MHATVRFKIDEAQPYRIHMNAITCWIYFDGWAVLVGVVGVVSMY